MFRQFYLYSSGDTSTPASATPTLTGANTFTSRTDITQNYVVTISNYSTLNALSGATWASPTAKDNSGNDVGTVSRTTNTITVVVPIGYEGSINVGIGFTETGKTQSFGSKSTVASLAVSATPTITGGTTVTEGSSLTLNVTPVAGASYAWSANEGSITPSGASAVWTPASTGTNRNATITCRVTEVGKLQSDPDTHDVAVSPDLSAQLRPAILTSEVSNNQYAWSTTGDRIVEGYTGNTITLARTSGDTTPQAFGTTLLGFVNRAAIEAWEPTVNLRVVNTICQLTGTVLPAVGTVEYRTGGVYQEMGITKDTSDGRLAIVNGGGRGARISGGSYFEVTGLNINTTNGVEIHVLASPKARKTTTITGVDAYGSTTGGEIFFSLGVSTSNNMVLRLAGTGNTYNCRRIGGGGTEPTLVDDDHPIQANQPLVLGLEQDNTTVRFHGTGVSKTATVTSTQAASLTALGTSATLRIGRAVNGATGVWGAASNLNTDAVVGAIIISRSMSATPELKVSRARMRKRLELISQQHLMDTKSNVEALFTSSGGDILYHKNANTTTKQVTGINNQVTVQFNTATNGADTPSWDYTYKAQLSGVQGIRNPNVKNSANSFKGLAPFMNDTMAGTIFAVMEVEDITQTGGGADGLAQVVSISSLTPTLNPIGSGLDTFDTSASVGFHHAEMSGITRVCYSKDPNGLGQFQPNFGGVAYDGLNQAMGKYPFNLALNQFILNEVVGGVTLTAAVWLAERGKAPHLPDNLTGAVSQFNNKRLHSAAMCLTWQAPEGYTTSTVPTVANGGQQADVEFYGGTIDGTPMTAPAFSYAQRRTSGQVSMPSANATVSSCFYLSNNQSGTHLMHAFAKRKLTKAEVEKVSANLDVLLY